MLELENPVIAAVRKDSEFESAINSLTSVIFLLKADIMSLNKLIEKKGNKKIFVHIDMAEGIGKDKKGLEYLKSIDVDGIITTKNHLVTSAKAMGLSTVQRFFIIDSASVDTATESINNAKPDYAEVMPGASKKVVEKMVSLTSVPIIAGGLIETKQDIITALNAGATAVSTGRKELWEI